MSKVALPRSCAPKVTLEVLKTYAAASGDYNPIHQDEAVAKAMGLPGVIAHGMLVAAWLTDYAWTQARKHVHAEAKIRKVQFRFRAMTVLGDALELEGDHE